MKSIVGSIMLITFALGSASALAANDPVEEAWYNNTRAKNTPFEWNLAKRIARASGQIAASETIQTDASQQQNKRMKSADGDAASFYH